MFNSSPVCLGASVCANAPLSRVLSFHIIYKRIFIFECLRARLIEYNVYTENHTQIHIEWSAERTHGHVMCHVMSRFSFDRRLLTFFFFCYILVRWIFDVPCAVCIGRLVSDAVCTVCTMHGAWVHHRVTSEGAESKNGPRNMCESLVRAWNSMSTVSHR